MCIKVIASQRWDVRWDVFLRHGVLLVTAMLFVGSDQDSGGGDAVEVQPGSVEYSGCGR